ncbi:MAG: M60 family metallopeptidase [Verrucomicrobiales bacterium]|nr:M60 family metallopeptidase [Verrucomicrobiales bacterium]
MKIPHSTPLVFALMFSTVLADEKVQQLIQSGGGEINFGKAVAGRIELTTQSAFPILQDAKGTIIAAGSTNPESGRAVGFTHGSFLKAGPMTDQESVAAVVQNSIRWAGKASAPSVGLHRSVAELEGMLSEVGFEVAVLAPGEVSRAGVSVYCLIGHEVLSADEVESLGDFLSDGNGLVTSTTPWAFGKKFEPFSTFPANQLVADFGFQFESSGTASKDLLVIGGASEARGEAMKTGGALAAVERLIDGHAELAGSELQREIAAMTTAKALTGNGLVEFLAGLKQLNEAVGPIIPTLEDPVMPGANPLVDAVIELETYFNENAFPGMMYAIPAAADYPGDVVYGAERVEHEFTIDGIYRGWLEGRNAAGWQAKEMRPTGVYALPGEVISVAMPARLADEGFEVVIGSYNGHLRNREKWHRYPDWQVTREVRGAVTEASSGLGGLVTIRVPRGAEYDEISVKISGGVKAPLYLHGETDLAEWKNEIRDYPGPWAELASERMIIAIPSEYIRNLDDPGEVMEVWDGIIEKSAELVRVDRENYRAERIVFDRQTAAGAMHSSYPVAAHLDKSAVQAVDAHSLKTEGNWGFFHEYGHNHQHNLWALPGTGETTCNLWSVYLYEEYIGKDRDETHRAIRPLDRKQRVNAYFDGGAKFDPGWAVWTALETYLMVQEEFGWEPFQAVFDEYNQLAPDERPKGQEEINDQWVIRLSKACGMSLHPFWATWNLPMTDLVEEELRELPVWEEHPVKRWGKAGS